ncbi:MAG: flagellar motor protein [Clostridia bacterium]|nr:flagellar motor protein [Clostridia bacterium]
MDLASVLGVVIAIGSLLLAVVEEGGSIVALAAATAALIVFGGTIGATMVCFSMNDIKTVPKLLQIAFTERKSNVFETINIIVSFAEKARREGLLSLEQELTNIDNHFLRQGVQLVVDGTDPALVKDILETEMAFEDQRHKIGAGIFEQAGGFAPTMGIIGTVMGLVNVLSNLSNPEELGGAIAVAFIATLYGVASANILWLPISAKLKLRNKQEALEKAIILEGVLSLQAGENPATVRDKLKAFLAPAAREIKGQGEV